MPAVLLELGFMDSRSDCPIILTEDYVDRCAEAIAEVIVTEWQLQPKTAVVCTPKDEIGDRLTSVYDQIIEIEKLAAGIKSSISDLIGN